MDNQKVEPNYMRIGKMVEYDGMKVSEVAKIVGLSSRTVSGYTLMYRNKLTNGGKKEHITTKEKLCQEIHDISQRIRERCDVKALRKIKFTCKEEGE
jgi:predicted transcriptional regulator